MAAPSYTNDLTDWILDSDTAAWGELTGATAGGAPDEVDTESALQGTNTVSQITNTTLLFSMCRILAAPVTLSAGQVFLVWHGHGVATALDTYTNGGLRLAVAGSTLSDWKAWAVGGVDTPPFPYGKWVNNAIDPNVTAEYTNGTPPTGATNIQGVGSMGILTQAVARGQPHVVDIIRYGRAEARINGGETSNYAIFSGFAAANDAQTARWGLIQKTDGGYLWKGLMTLGYTSLVDFRDSNTTIFIQDTRKVYSTFNKIEIRQATSRVDWTTINFVCLSPSTTASKGDLEMIDAADVNIDACNFTDMNTFIFLSSGAIINSKFLRCGQITSGGAIFTGTSILQSTVALNTSALIWNAATDPDGKLDDTIFSKGANAHHAIEFGLTSPTSMTLRGVTTTGFNASNGQNDSTLHIKRTTGTVTINLVGCSGNFSYRTDGATVVIVSDPVTTTVVVRDEDSVLLANAVILLYAANGTGDLPFEDSVGISRSGSTVTVTHTSHGLATNNYVRISGAAEQEYNGVHQITVTDPNTYTYTIATTPATPATGTPVSTGVLIYGTTSGTGQLSDTRTFSVDQPVTGWVRKSTSAPYYKESPLSGNVVDSTSGLTINVQMIPDE